MQRTAVNHASANDRRALSAICDDLQCLTKKQLRGRDVDTVRAAIQELKFLDRIRGDLECLGDELAKIEKEHDSDLAHFPDQVGKTDLASCTFALDAACRFLSLLVPCHNLTLLKDALYQLVAGGSPPAMFHPEDHPKGRRPDVPNLMAAKGILAGMMHVQQSTGMPRKVAAQWIVTHISPNLVARISGKPLTARTVEEWLDRYGGEFADSNAGRQSYLTWSQGEPVSAKRFREITERIAKILPGRKPR